MTSDDIPSLDDARRRRFRDSIAGGTYRPPAAVSCLSGVFLLFSLFVIVGVVAGWLTHPAWVIYLLFAAIGSFFYARFLARKQRESRTPKPPQTDP